MTLTFDIGAEFGSLCADGDAAAQFREARIDPYVGITDLIVLDFAGVRNANTSFCNALIANLMVVHGQEVLQKLRFAHCRENVKVLLCAALDLGNQIAGERRAVIA
ncbi:MAG TPA: DUF4325 domain-containing protein [Longimicrobium sp.]|jgi:hypothetical protein